MKHTVGLVVLLAVIWLLNSGHYEVLFFIFGACSVGLVAYISHRMVIVDHETAPIHLTPRLIPFYSWLFKQIVLSNIDVLRHIWSRRSSISPASAWISTCQNTDMGKVIYANSITLTPGTVTMDIQGDRLLVHALTSEALSSLESGEMDRRVEELTP